MVSLHRVSPSKSCIHLSSPPIRATCPTHLILLDLSTRTILGEEYRSLSSSLCSFLHSFVTSSLLAPNILLNTLFSNTLSLRPSRNVSDQVTYPYKTIGKIIFPYTLIFKFLDNNQEDKCVCVCIYIYIYIYIYMLYINNICKIKDEASPIYIYICVCVCVRVCVCVCLSLYFYIYIHTHTHTHTHTRRRSLDTNFCTYKNYCIFCNILILPSRNLLIPTTIKQPSAIIGQDPKIEHCNKHCKLVGSHRMETVL